MQRSERVLVAWRQIDQGKAQDEAQKDQAA
jgi:hypothetical protein